ncbi:hypothetical protein UP10_03965 [Bradyrhizobium sp. LTSPM299]|uniref:hypothetical protein n=1 Tax=Bradyrhizobium sp. LTSPM299 TaxID=1619233 RepID=UPI0005C859CD|nr:hypothetical protein [Bradyrhizobium sp. LTSPM299]KJC62472.1 hypothetical protein UP10_03965 [Bradyrhizobium sp. LTSPM299]
MHNEISVELNFNELDRVSGGGPIEWLIGYLAGKALDALSHATDHTPTNVLNGMLGAIGRPPIT